MKEILNKKSEDYARKCLDKVLDVGLNFKLNSEVKQKVFDKSMIDKMIEVPVNGIELNELLVKFEKEVIPYCSNFSSSNFMGFPDAGNSVAGISGAILADFLQQNLINSSFCAPIATYMEIAVITWFRKLLGYKIKPVKSIWDVGGIITYGGTGSNATAMLLARENYHSDTMTKGVLDPNKYKVIIPKGIGHYSIRSSLMWIGCGDNVIEVETENFKYDLKALKKTLVANKGKVMCVVCYAGDSRTMTIDNFKEVHDLVKKIDKNIWLHADACHGFSLAFSKKLKNKISGIELFDSISTDPHKVLEIPYCISALLIKKPEKFKLITSTSDLIMQEDFAFGQITPFIGSKSWISLKIWFMMKNMGVRKIGEIIERRHKMAIWLKDEIIKSKEFILLNDVSINSVVFMYVGDKEKIDNTKIDELNEMNLKIYNYLLNEGKYYLHKFTIPDNLGVIKKDAILVPLRYMSGNDNISKKNIKSMLNHVIDVSKKI